ncbi:hypothetical protein CN980_31290 [Bacillus cereus]|uniref:Uncharacterized protein n=1 Tax=Bacillus cereus TaxID=1396 RepID=A0A9X7C5P1_BACCE|nr:hypothetical protein CN980_31290 [Bacillus cereus]
MIVRIFNENYNKMMSKGRLKVLIEFLEFISILALVVVLTLTVMLQDIFFIDINKQYTETRIGAIIFCIRMLFGTWVVFVTETTIIAVSKVTVIQLIILLLFWACSKYVQKTRENWLITIVAFVIYGVGTYMYIQFAFRGY